MPNRDLFVEAVNEYLFGLVVATPGSVAVKTLLPRVLLAIPEAHLVVVLPDDVSALAMDALVGRRLVAMPASADRDALVHALRRAWFEGRVECIRRAARQQIGSAALRCAVSRILDERVTEKHPEPDEVTLHRSLGPLAAACGTSLATLRRARRRCGIDLPALMRGWTAALGLHERFVELDVPTKGAWSAIARRCGYESESGLRGLMNREVGVQLPELGLGHLHELLDRLESSVVENVSA